MPVHVQTGNGLDVVFEYDKNDRQVITGLKPLGGQLIPLRDPRGLAEVLLKIVEECERSNKIW